MDKFDLLFEEATKSKEQFVDEIERGVSIIVKNTLNPSIKSGIFETKNVYLEDTSFRFKIEKYPIEKDRDHKVFKLIIGNEPKIFDYLASVFKDSYFSYSSKHWISIKYKRGAQETADRMEAFYVPLLGFFQHPYHKIMSDIVLLAGKLYDQHYSIEHLF